MGFKETTKNIAEEEPQQDDFDQQTPTILTEADKYLKAGAHIGTKFKSGQMLKYVFKERKDGLKVMNIQTLDSRIKLVAELLAKFEPKQIVVVSRKLYGHTAVKKFAEIIGCKEITGRFVPGTFTNPQSKQFTELKALLATESDIDLQAINEASSVHSVVVSLVSTNNTLKNVDLAVPINNKGRKSLALFYYLLAREYQKIKGAISSDSEFNYKVDDFEFILQESHKEQARLLMQQSRQNRGKRGSSSGPRRSDSRSSDRGSFRPRRDSF
ncbi:MAG: 30S ribosomal protein S2 [Candidatus Diapherotrites archaeon]|nr:30S ribosomal protein S2 [Candidatus Diapherotrites archaeon]